MIIIWLHFLKCKIWNLDVFLGIPCFKKHYQITNWYCEKVGFRKGRVGSNAGMQSRRQAVYSTISTLRFQLKNRLHSLKRLRFKNNYKQKVSKVCSLFYTPTPCLQLKVRQIILHLKSNKLLPWSCLNSLTSNSKICKSNYTAIKLLMSNKLLD